MKILKLLSLLALVSTLFLLHSCGAIAKGTASKQYTVEKGAIPKEFGKDNSTLVCVLTGRNSRDKYLKKHFKNIYKGKYIFAFIEDLSSKYADTKEYRYLFTYKTVFGPTTIKYDKITDKVYTEQTTASNYYLVDRTEEKTYRNGFSSGYFGKLIQAYVANLEKQRLINQ